MRTMIVRAAILTLLPLMLASCGRSEPTGPRVFFVQPQDGATVKSPVRLEFGVENDQVAAVPAGTVTESRPNIGHHHVGVDADCLPPGTVIPRAAPWVHFGDGKNVIDMQLPPGQHRLTLQIGDDLHRTQEGLCSMIRMITLGVITTLVVSG